MNASNIFLFLIGLFSMTQVRIIGAIGLSEIPIFLCAPFLFLADFNILRRQGFMPLLSLILLTCLGCIVSSLHNHTYYVNAIKGFATPYSMFAVTVVLNHLLKDNLEGMKWLLVGSAFTLILNVFILPMDAEVQAFAEGATGFAAGKIIAESSTIFWISRIRPLITLPIAAWYTKTPLWYSIGALMAFIAFALISSSSGRSTALWCVLAVTLILICRKSRASMVAVKRHVILALVCVAVMASVFSAIYKYGAEQYWFGEVAYEKYRRQSKSGSGVLRLLMSGRAETFIGFFACLDKPVLGHGPWAIDTKDYIENFLRDYGDYEDYQNLVHTRVYWGSLGYSVVKVIPGHSHIVTFWLWYGIFGLLLWLYVLWLIYKYFTKYLDVVPQWFGYFAVTISASLWGIFFSPYSQRILFPLLFCALIYVRNVANRKMNLPPEMLREASEY